MGITTRQFLGWTRENSRIVLEIAPELEPHLHGLGRFMVAWNYAENTLNMAILLFEPSEHERMRKFNSLTGMEFQKKKEMMKQLIQTSMPPSSLSIWDNCTKTIDRPFVLRSAIVHGFAVPNFESGHLAWYDNRSGRRFTETDLNKAIAEIGSFVFEMGQLTASVLPSTGRS
jgi:hypothetical protein